MIIVFIEERPGPGSLEPTACPSRVGVFPSSPATRVRSSLSSEFGGSSNNCLKRVRHAYRIQSLAHMVYRAKLIRDAEAAQVVTGDWHHTHYVHVRAGAKFGHFR